MPTPVLLYRTVPLRSGRRGEPLTPLALVRDMNAAHVVQLEGQLPPGLDLGVDGVVRGTPTTVGYYQFRLVVADVASLEPITQQAYALRIVVPAARTAAAPASAPSAPSRLQTLAPDETEALADSGRGMPISYKLTPANLATLVPPEEPAQATTAPAAVDAAGAAPGRAAADAGTETRAALESLPAAPLLPTAEQLQAMLTPLIDIEYPTRVLFEQALQAGRCSYYSTHVTEQAMKKNLLVDATCPPAPERAALNGSAARPAAHGSAGVPGFPGSGKVSLAQFYLDLMPADLQAQIVSVAEKKHPIEDAVAPVWTAGCGCHPPSKDDDAVYGLFPYWLATEAPQAVDFSVFSRIGLMGAILKDDGNFMLPRGFTDDTGSPARIAARHGTALDLVIYRRDWNGLLRLPIARQEEIARVAARNAVMLADSQFNDATSRWVAPLLWPVWREQEQLYGGLTVFFDHTPTDARSRKAFKDFHRHFMQRLIIEMQAIGRSYELSVIVPELQLGDEDSAYGFAQLSDYMEAAQPRPSKANADEATVRRYRGKTDIAVLFLLLMNEPTSMHKKHLRAKVDESTELQGHRRVAFLDAMVPVQFAARSDKPLPMTPEKTRQLSDDLAYLKWNYGGAGFWPLPVEGMGSGSPVRQLASSAFSATSQPQLTSGLCDLTCPRRLGLRLTFQLLLTVDVALLIAYATSCRVRRFGGQRLLMMLWVGNLFTLALAAMLFTCDPSLQALRAGNMPLYALVAILCAAGAYASFRGRTDPP